MKTFGKKLFSLMLAALMLVGAMPLAAFADEADADVQADAGTPVVVEDGTNTYDESGSDDNQAAFQDAGNFNLPCKIIVHVGGNQKKTETANFELVSESDNKKVNIRQNYDSLTDKEKQTITKNALSAAKISNSSMYVIDPDSLEGTFDSTNKTFTIDVLYKSHDCQKYAKYTEVADDDDYHTITCSICHSESQTEHNYKASGVSEKGHTDRCSQCGHERTTAHTLDFYKTIDSSYKKGDKLEDNGETVTVLTAATDASCTKKAKYAYVQYDCGYKVGGEEYGSMLDHEYNSKDVCIHCGTKKDGEKVYDVNIYLTRGSSTPLLTGTAKLTNTTINNLSTNASGAKSVLSKTTGSTDDEQKIIDAYAKDMSSYYSSMGRAGTVIDIYVTEDISKTIDSDNPEVDITIYGALVTNSDGQLVEDDGGYTRTLTVGKSYFDQIKQTDPTGKRTLVSMKVTGASGTRTINKANSASTIKVRSDDTEVQLIWSAKKVTVKFYRTADSSDSDGLVATRSMRAGEVIDNLPTLDGESVSWYLENGTLLQEGATFYDFNTDVIRAYPGGSSGAGVYLFIYKNGDTSSPVSNEPVSITKFVSSKGYVNRDELTATIEKAVNKKNVKITGLFDYNGWAEYVSSKSTKNASTGIYVGESADRTSPQFLYVMVDAGSSSSSSKADSSNPKTGDTAMIGTAFAVLTVAAIGLGTATVVLKKKEEF